MTKQFLGTASIVKRILAFIFDLLLINFIIRPFQSMILKILGNPSWKEALSMVESNPEALGSLTTILFFISVLSLLYFAVMEWKFSQTLGHMLVGIYVQSEKKDPKLWQFIISNLFILPFFPFFILWFADPAYMFFYGKRFSERVAGLKTVQKYVM